VSGRGAIGGIAPRRGRGAGRALYHAEVSALESLRYATPVRCLVYDAAGVQAVEQLEREVAEAKEQLGVQTSVEAAFRVLSTLAALHKMSKTGHRRGYRGVVAPLARFAEAVRQATGERCSLSTARNAVRILERAGLVERSEAMRGHATPYGEPGRKRRWARRAVACITLPEDTIDLWTVRRAPTSDDNLSLPLETSGSPILEQGASPPCFTRTTLPSPESGDESPPLGGVEESAPPGGGTDGSTGPPPRENPLSLLRMAGLSPPQETPPVGGEEAASRGQAARRAPPPRRFSHRPSPTAGNSWAIARSTWLYDLETALIQAFSRASIREELLDRAILETSKHFRGEPLMHWDRYLSAWRQLDQEQRRRVMTTEILPALRKEVRRRALESWERDPTHRRPRGKWLSEPPPRKYPSGDYGFRARSLEAIRTQNPTLAADVDKLISLGLVTREQVGSVRLEKL